MQLFRVDDWRAKDKLQTPIGPWAGIAIGPDSEEAVCRVNGYTLQAGRVLPLPSGNQAYSIERIVGKKGTADDSATTTASINRLDLCLFECGTELAAYQPRPAHRYTAQNTAAVWPSVQTLRTVPFVGRRQAAFLLTAATGGTLIGYSVFGRRFSLASQAMVTVPLVSVPPAAGPLQFYIGGTDHAELFDELTIAVGANTSDTVTCEVELVGEAGAS